MLYVVQKSTFPVAHKPKTAAFPKQSPPCLPTRTNKYSMLTAVSSLSFNLGFRGPLLGSCLLLRSPAGPSSHSVSATQFKSLSLCYHFAAVLCLKVILTSVLTLNFNFYWGVSSSCLGTTATICLSEVESPTRSSVLITSPREAAAHAIHHIHF